MIYQGLYLTTIFALFGEGTLVLAFLVGVISFLFLETINYIEHYGLRRKKIGDKYERVQNIHSWNSDHIMGRIILYELTRHSDHHFRASKKYQVLESLEDSPRLPFGYPMSCYWLCSTPMVCLYASCFGKNGITSDSNLMANYNLFLFYINFINLFL